MNHLFTGSRAADDNLKLQVRAAVRFAIEQGELIVVGDASGIDETVIDEADKAHYTNIEVYGYGGKMHHKTKWGINVPFLGDPLSRDRFMVIRSHRCTAYWDGKSRGTKYTFEYAKRKGLPTLVTNGKGIVL